MDYKDLEKDVKKKIQKVRKLICENKNINISNDDVVKFLKQAMNFGSSGLKFMQREFDGITKTLSEDIDEYLESISNEEILKLFNIFNGLNNATDLVKKYTKDLKDAVKNKKENVTIDLSTSLIVDSIINVKSKKFSEYHTNEKDIYIVKTLLENKLKDNGINVIFADDILDHYSNTEFIFKHEDINLDDISENINDNKIFDIIFDEEYIYNILVQIMINKLNNSIEHDCFNCDINHACYLREFDDSLKCDYFRHDYNKVPLSNHDKKVISKVYKK